MEAGKTQVAAPEEQPSRRHVLVGVRAKTLPINMLQYVEEAPDLTIAVLSTLILAATLVLPAVGDRLAGLHRMAGTGERR
jgi:putative spermidine/putrescine transport system permease protein